MHTNLFHSIHLFCLKIRSVGEKIFGSIVGFIRRDILLRVHLYIHWFRLVVKFISVSGNVFTAWAGTVGVTHGNRLHFNVRFFWMVCIRERERERERERVSVVVKAA